MRKVILFCFLILLSVITACTLPDEIEVAVELRDKNLGYTQDNFNVACIVTHSALVDSVEVTLVSDDETFTSRSTEPATVTELGFSNVPDGKYTSTCVICAGEECSSSETGTVLVSSADDSQDVYELDVPPSFILGTPIDKTYFLSADPLLISFSCLANDDFGLTAVSLVTNISGVLSETFIQDPARNTHLLTKDLVLRPGTYLWTCRATDNRAQTTVAPIRSFVIGPATPLVLPKVDTFDGATTDFASLPTLTDVPNVTLENTDFGQISFVDNISSLVGVDLDKGIIITQNSITVNSTLYPQLNVPARLSFYNIEFDEETEQVDIEKDGSTYEVKDLTVDDNIISFDVANFSTYTVVITPQGGFNLEEGEGEEEVVEEEPEEEVVEEPTETPQEDDATQDSLDFAEDDTQEPVEDLEFQDSEVPEEEQTTDTQEGSTDQTTDDTTAPVEAEQEEAPVEATPTEDDEEPEEPIYIDPFVMILVIGGFIVVVALVIWLIRRNSRGPILKHY